MNGTRTWLGGHLAWSMVAHLALLLAFGLPAALQFPQGAPIGEPRSRPPRSVPVDRARRGAEGARRLDRALPTVRAQPAEERKLVILHEGSGTGDHDARATSGMPGLPHAASASSRLGADVRLPAWEPNQLENPERDADDRSQRKAAERAPLQRPEIAGNYGVFASVVSSGQASQEAGRPSLTAAASEAPESQQAAPHAAPLPPESPSSAALPPPPGSALASMASAARASGGEVPLPDELMGRQGNENARAAGIHSERSRDRVAQVVREEPMSDYSSRRDLSKAVRVALLTGESRAKRERSSSAPQRSEDEEQRLARAKPREAGTPESFAARGGLERRWGEEEEAAALASPDKAASGLWVAEAPLRSGEASANEGPPRQPSPEVATSAQPRAAGAGDESSRRAKVRSDADSEAPRGLVTSKERRLGIEALEGGEQGARVDRESRRLLASADRRFVGDQSVAGAQDGAPVAGPLVVAPEGDGSGEDWGGASVSGNGDLRHIVQERINHVVSLVGPGIVKRSGAKGVAIVRFRVDVRGYVRGVKLERSSGAEALDLELEAVIRLAEPYPGWRGWMRAAVAFGALPSPDL